MNITNGALVRGLAIVLLCALCLASALYVGGAYEFSFIDRHPNIEAPTTEGTLRVESTSTPEETTSPVDVTESTTGGDITTDESTDTDTDFTDVSTTSSGEEGFAPHSVADYISKGYSITYKDYTKSMVLAEITLPAKYSSLHFGKKIYRECIEGTIYSDESFIRGDMKMTETNRLTVESYMGYLLIAADKQVSVYDGKGELLFTTTERLSPAYTRDKENRPLYFINGKKEFYYIDFETKELVLNITYNDDTDNRGLYFNYNPSFGVSDNGYDSAWQANDYVMTLNVNMEVAWERANVSSIFAKELWRKYPDYATLVAKVNKRFAAALAVAKKEIAAEEKEKEESLKAEASNTTETLSPPPPVTAAPDIETNNNPPSETTVAEGTVSPSAETTSPSDSTSESGDTTSSPSDGTVETSSPTTGETTAPETEEQFPSHRVEGPISISVTLNGPRYGYTKGASLLLGYKYARTFSFSNGRGAVVGDDGRLTYLGTNFGTYVNGRRSFSEPMPGGTSSVWYIASFYEPVYKDFRSIGSYYYDSGYVVIREVSIQSMRHGQIGYDRTYLIDKWGDRIDPPTGFNFVSCTGGIMLVERDGRYGYYDIQSKTWITNPVYSYAEPFYEGVAVVGNADGKGLINESGDIVLPLEFDYVSTMSTGIVTTFSEDGGWRAFAKMSK